MLQYKAKIGKTAIFTKKYTVLNIPVCICHTQ